MTDADDERPFLLHGSGLHRRSGGHRSAAPSASKPREEGVERTSGFKPWSSASEPLKRALSIAYLARAVVAKALLDEAAVVPRVAQFRTFGNGVLEQLQCIFKCIVAALRSDALQRLDDQVLAGAAANSLGARAGPQISVAVSNG